MAHAYTWDQIRCQVKAFRSLSQATYPPESLTTLKYIHFDTNNHRLYFLSNGREMDGCYGRFLVLYQVDYNSQPSQLPDNAQEFATDASLNMDTLFQLPVLEWKPVFGSYAASRRTAMEDGPFPLTDMEQQYPIQGIAYYECVNDVILISASGGLFVSQAGKIPVHIPSRPKQVCSPTGFPTPPSFDSPCSSPSDPMDIHSKVSCGTTNGSTHGATHYTEGRSDPKLGGSNNQLIAFIRQRDIWVATMEGVEAQLTFCSLQTKDPTLSCGVAEYVMQEEFHRWTGYYWGPPTKNGLNRILYLETSEDMVDTVTISKQQPNGTSQRTDGFLRYPRAGRSNAVSDLQMVLFGDIFHDAYARIEHKRLQNGSINECFPWAEYIVRFGWLPDGESVWAQIVSREQNRTAVVRIKCSQFISKNEQEIGTRYAAQLPEPYEILWEETTDKWINVSDAFYFLSGAQTPDCTRFIWSSEKSGYRHLYLVNKYHDSPAPIVEQITSGDWCVMDHPIQVDECRQLVYFMAKKDTPLEAHLYVTSYAPAVLRRERVVSRLTMPGFSHAVEMNAEAGVFVDTFSSLRRPPQTILCHLQYSDLSDPFSLPAVAHSRTALLIPTTPEQDIPDKNLHKSHLASIIAKPTPLSTWESKGTPFPTIDTRVPYTEPMVIYDYQTKQIPWGEIFSFHTADGVKLYGCMYKPRMYRPGQSYPTVLHVYGGPKTQMVANDVKFPRLLRYLMSVYFGFAVVVIDGRGSNDRGLHFEAHLSNRLGTVEMADQLAGLEYLAKTKFGAEPTPDGELVSVIDLDRVAITGWSYGGYLSLMALAQHTNRFKMAIAGAPVTDWELYDSAYTERYLGLPSSNRAAYENGSVIKRVKHFPDSEHRLLIAHGLIDENVHFANTELLVAELVKHNKPHYLQVYPTEKHGLRHTSVNEHFETLMFFWLVNYL